MTAIVRVLVVWRISRRRNAPDVASPENQCGAMRFAYRALRSCAFKGDFEPETSVDSGQQLLGCEAVLGF